jgi:hypothetical protein
MTDARSHAAFLATHFSPSGAATLSHVSLLRILCFVSRNPIYSIRQKGSL